MSKLFKILFVLIMIILVMMLFQLIYNQCIYRKVNKVNEERRLTKTDKKSLQELFKIRDYYGEKIWPGFNTNIPVIIYNEKYEFLINYPGQLKNWDQVKNDTFKGKPYYRKNGVNSMAFTVDVNGLSCGSMSSLPALNKDILNNLKRELPFLLNRLVPYKLLLKSNDFHVVSIIHEVFHAFQNKISPEKFKEAQTNYSIEKDYPYKNNKLNSLFSREGKLLSKALNSDERDKKIELLYKFLQIRKKRRKNISSKFILFEKRYEWLEGLARYVEIKTYEIAQKNKGNLKLMFNYKEGLPHWNTDFNNLNNLGDLNSEYRFYLSGMALARLLDQLDIKWQKTIMEEGIYFEDIIEGKVDLLK